MKRRAFWLGLSALLLLAVACSLNTQPIPPGDDNSVFGAGQDAGNTKVSDSGAEGAHDSGTPGDGGTVTHVDGDASDAGDAGASDASASDASADAMTDAGDSG